MTAEPLRIGILGAARIAELAIVTPARATGTRLVTVAARDRRRAEAFAAEHGVERATDSYAEVLADPEVELVYNPLPNAYQGPWNLAAVAAGKHVLSEKPFASSAEEAAEVRDAATKAGVTVVDGFHYLFHPVMQRLFASSTPVSWASSSASRRWSPCPSRTTATRAGRTGSDTRTEHLGTRSSYVYQLEELIPALRGGAPMPTGPDDAVATAQLIDRCYRAAGLPLRNRKWLTPTEGRS